jgi:DNA mismatch endonuclease (patch repair protein)
MALTPEQLRRCMQANRSTGTKPEKVLARELWHRGYRYRKNVRGIPGTPDICFKSKKVAVFVDGDFWHGRDWLHARQRIKSNQEFWYGKIERNIARDHRTDQRLKARGWRVLRFWASDVMKHTAECADRVEAVLREEQIEHLHRVYLYDTQYDTVDVAAEEEFEGLGQD